jgi:tripeptide aminopeptidase
MDDRYIKSAEQLLMELLAIPGPSCREQEVMEFIAARLRRAGAPKGSILRDQAHRHSQHGGQVGNMVCRLPGTRPGGRRLLMAHVDTVPLCEGARPVRRGGWIVPADKHTGLGADDRAGTAVVLAAALEILKHQPSHPPLCFLWTVQEELGLFGARHARLGMLGKPRLAFNFDGGPIEKVTMGATGGYRMKIRVTGIASHAGVAPEQGISAITIAALAIAELQREGWLGKIEKQGRSGTSNIGLIHGGEATNVVTPLAELRAEARSHDPAFRQQIISAIEAAFSRAAHSVQSSLGARGGVEVEGQLDYEAYRLPDDDPSLLAAEEAVRGLGGEPFRAISNGGLDANWLTARGIPTVSLGCGQTSPHTTAERLDRAEFHRACGLALRLALGEG